MIKLPVKIQRVLDSILGPEAHSPQSLRIAAANRAATDGGAKRETSPVPTELQPYIDNVSRTPYQVVDGDIETLKAQGLSEDEIFELTVATAFGAAAGRFEKTLALLDEDEA